MNSRADTQPDIRGDSSSADEYCRNERYGDCATWFQGGAFESFSDDGSGTVIADGIEYKQLAVNKMDSGFMAFPAFVDDALILRTEMTLYRTESPMAL